MKTQIFATYTDFLDRTDVDLNGVSPAFAANNPGWDDERENRACWNCSGCSGCSRCSDCSGCSGCSGCSDCSRCSDCSDCSRCSDVWDQKGVVGVQPSPDIPVLENIHQRLLAAVEAAPDQFDMRNWHGSNSCGTTHCRAGFIVDLAGEAGKALEKFHDTPLAAFLIYQASSPSLPVRMPRFYESDEVAMADIRRMAELEKQAAAQ